MPHGTPVYSGVMQAQCKQGSTWLCIHCQVTIVTPIQKGLIALWFTIPVLATTTIGVDLTSLIAECWLNDPSFILLLFVRGQNTSAKLPQNVAIELMFFLHHIATHLVVMYVVLIVFLVGATLFKKAYSSVISNWIWMKFYRIVLQVNMYRPTESFFDMTHAFKMAGHDVCLSLAGAYAAESAGCPLAHRPHATSLACCMHYSS